MPVRKAKAEWKGNLKDGTGTISSESGALKNIAYNFVSRFEQGIQTNPEELIGAAHSACFTMALANSLAKAGFTVNSVKTDAKVYIDKLDAGFTITKIELETVGDIAGVDEKTFLEHAEQTKTACPVSKALLGPMLILNAKLK
ncbi:OsmC family protein [Candidatus Bathyarchaeota archaeon]|nr:OsmC family protein [Candidatus Bathyarchaeota archaeon]